MKSVLLILLVIVGGITAVVAETQDNDGNAVAPTSKSESSQSGMTNRDKAESLLKKLDADKKIVDKLRIDRHEQTTNGWIYIWKEDPQTKYSLRVHVAVLSSSQDAAALFHKLKMMDNSGGPVIKGELGDEAFICKSELSDTCAIVMRKANVLIQLTAVSVRLAKDVAEWICDEIDPKRLWSPGSSQGSSP